MKRTVELRSYNLKKGVGAEFDRIVRAESLPMLARWGVDVVASGPSLHDEDSYFLIRAYDSLEHRTASQKAFYGSAEWNEGPRDRIVSLIESYATVVLELEASVVDALRT